MPAKRKMVNRPSGTERWFTGKPYPGANATVRKIVADDSRKLRFVHLDNGTVLEQRAGTLKRKFIRAMARYQADNAMEMRRTNPDGSVTVMVGGLEKGVERSFSSAAKAKTAVDAYHSRLAKKEEREKLLEDQKKREAQKKKEVQIKKEVQRKKAAIEAVRTKRREASEWPV